jgi:hypothetical protein
MGAVFSEISGNHIYGIWTKRQFTGFEIAGIKIHGAIDTLIRNNRIHNAGRGIWLDWMTQGTRVTGNLCYDNSINDLFSEVNHGPYLVDNNLFLSDKALLIMSYGGAYAHNLAAGLTRVRTTSRKTPYHKQHSTQVAGLRDLTEVGDIRFYNNMFVGEGKASPGAGADRRKGAYGLGVYNDAGLPMYVDGNVYLNGALPYAKGSNRIERPDFDPGPEVIEKGGGVYLRVNVGCSWNSAPNKLVTTELLGRAMVPDLPYVNIDGSPLKVGTDYFGKKRGDNPTPGPFENPPEGRIVLKVWPAGPAAGPAADQPQ